MKWYIHIGMHKTGTTSIQKGLWRVREQLADKGYCYPGSMPNHSLFLQSLVLHHDDAKVRGSRAMNRKLNIINADSFKKLQEQALLMLASARNPQYHSAILSAESLSMLRRDPVLAFKDLLLSSNDEAKIIIYLRDPVSYASSIYHQHVKGGGSGQNIKILLPRYRQKVKHWIEIFGNENLTIRPFNRDDWPEGDLYKDFFSAVDLDPSLLDSNDFKIAFSSDGENKSFSNEVVQLLEMLNIENSLGGDNERQHRPYIDIERILMGFSGGKYKLPNDVIAEVVRLSKEDIAWINRVARRELFGLEVTRNTENDPDYKSLALYLLRVINGQSKK